MKRCLPMLGMFMGGLLGAQNIFTVAGIPPNHRDDVDGQPALSAPLGNVYGLLIDKLSGRLLFHDQMLVLRLEPDGSLLTVAGSSSYGVPLTSSTTLASGANTGTLRGMAQDASGALYLSDAQGGRVLRITPGGTVSTFAGGGPNLPGFQSDGGQATAALLESPRGLVFDSKGNLDIAEVFCNCIRRVTPQGIISTVYTLPPASTSYHLQSIEGLAIDAQDNLYFTEWIGNLVGKVASDGSGATILAGTGAAGFSGDGGAATAAQLNGPSGVTLDSSGNVYIADTLNNRVRKITADGTIATIAGSGAPEITPSGTYGTCAFSGDGGPAGNAHLCLPAEILFDSAGSLLIADYGNFRVRRMGPDGTIATIAGNGKLDPAMEFQPSSGNGEPEIHATFNMLGGAAFDAAGNLYVSETGGNIIRKIAANGTVSTFAGNGQPIFSGDGGPALQAGLLRPGPVSVGPDGSLYVITGDDRVRKITADGIIHPVAGSGPGSGINRAQGDGGPAVDATLNEPGGVALDQHGNVYIADTSNARVRKVDANGIITTVAGPGQGGVDYYNDVAVDPKGNLYVAWTHASSTSIYATVNLVNPDGSLTRVAGSGQPCTNGPGQWTGDGLPAVQARLCAVTQMAVDPSGRLELSEGGYSLVLRLNADGTIQRMAGNTKATAVGDGGPALQASLVGGQGWSPEAVTFDPAGNMYIPEAGLNIVREVTNAPYTVTLAPSQINATGPVTVSVATSANFAEEFAYAVRVSTVNGGSWLSVNRVTGVTGKPVKVTVNSTGLAAGTYAGTVAVLVAVNGGSQETDLPVMLTVQ